MTPDDVLISKYWEFIDKSKLEQKEIWRVESAIRWTFRQSILYSKNHSLLNNQEAAQAAKKKGKEDKE